MTDLHNLSIRSCLAMNLVADLPHRASESVLYPTIAEDDGLAVTHCLPWLRARGLEPKIGCLVYAPRVILAEVCGPIWTSRVAYRFAEGATWAEALCRLVVRVHEAEEAK